LWPLRFGRKRRNITFKFTQEEGDAKYQDKKVVGEEIKRKVFLKREETPFSDSRKSSLSALN